MWLFTHAFPVIGCLLDVSTNSVLFPTAKCIQKGPKNQMLRPTTPTIPSSKESSAPPAPRTPERAHKISTASSAIESLGKALKGSGSSPPVPTSPPLVYDTPPALSPFRILILKGSTILLTDKLIFHGSDSFLDSKFRELQAAIDYHKAL